MPVAHPLSSTPEPMERPATVVAVTGFTIISRLASGLPRGLRVKWRNMRRSIPVHPLVPGGKRRTGTAGPSPAANSTVSPSIMGLGRPLSAVMPRTP